MLSTDHGCRQRWTEINSRYVARLGWNVHLGATKTLTLTACLRSLPGSQMYVCGWSPPGTAGFDALPERQPQARSGIAPVHSVDIRYRVGVVDTGFGGYLASIAPNNEPSRKHPVGVASPIRCRLLRPLLACIGFRHLRPVLCARWRGNLSRTLRTADKPGSEDEQVVGA